MKNKKSLKKNIFQLLILFTLFVVLVIGGYVVNRFYHSKIDSVKYNQKQALLQVESEVNLFISDIERIAKYIRENYSSNSLLLKSIVEPNPNIESLLILNKYGIIENIYAQNNLNIYKGFDYSHKPYFKKINEEHTQHWSNVFLSTINEEPTLSYSFKMQDRVVVMMIRLNRLTQFILRFKNYDTSHMIRIFDKNGVLLMNPDNKELVSRRFNALNKDVFTKFINKVNPYSTATFQSLTQENTQFGSYIKFDKTQWYIVVRENQSEILKSLNQIFIGIGFAVVVFLLFAVYISLKISKRIFRSFEDLELTTSKISEGNYEIETKELYYKEFDSLLQSFNRMKIEIDKREETLENSLKSFKSLFNSTMESIILHDKGVCIDVNNVTLNLFKVDDKSYFIGIKFLDLVSKKFKKMVKSNYDKDTEPYEIELTRFDGSKIIALIQGKLLTIDNKRIQVCAIIDITELRTKDKLLFQHTKMASMGEMIGNIAHQWRQPLSAISSTASGITLEKKMGTLGEERLIKSMGTIMDKVEYLSKTIDAFRNFFHPNKEKEVFNIDEVLKASLKLAQANLESENIKVDSDLTVRNIQCVGYPNELIQVLINLFNNAKDAFISNNITNRVICVNDVLKEDKYFIMIKDNAGGIPESIIDKVFEPYYTTKDKAQGTGIGLYMSHQIITDNMKGELFVENVEQVIDQNTYKGACFYIRIPTFNERV